MNKTIGIIAHVDAGKTTLCERLLHHTNVIGSFGRVDHKNTHLDNHKIEKERGITVFSEQAVINYKDDTYFLIDTPGHIDFSAEMERNLMVMDYAVIIISAVEGIQGHTETVWKLLQRHNIPTFFFINKIDREGADIDKVFQEIKDNLTENTAIINGKLEDELEESFIETVADLDYELLDMYLEGEYDKGTWIKHTKILMKELMFYPCFTGSALQDTGIIEFWDNLHILTETNYKSNSEFQGRIFKIRHDNTGNRVSFIKINNGNLSIKDEITYNINGIEYTEKINEIRLYSGNEYTSIETSKSGSLIGITGLSNTFVGMNIGEFKDNNNELIFDMLPALKSKLIYDSKTHSTDIINALKILNAEDPMLKYEWNSSFKEIHINVMGVIQLEVLKEVLLERFEVNVNFEQPGILYKETIMSSVIGRGHFEPLKHYAEVHLQIEPLSKNSGIVFANLCSNDNLSKGNQNLVEQHIFEREHRGLLTGNPITDIKITLINGRGHNKHTSGGDFREATYRALRQGLEKTKSEILEPFYEFKIKIDTDYLGKVLSDIQRLNGIFDPPHSNENSVTVTGKAPVSSFMNYPKELLALSSGKGLINLRFIGYDICHNTKDIIDKFSYNKDTDPEYSSSSVFCSKGQAYTVMWDKADNEMHCK